MSPMTVEMSKPDQFGQCHPTETPELIAAKLKELEVQLNNITKKDAYEQALSRCPDQLDDDFKLQFLRCEVFHASKAAERLTKYWQKRLDIFGSEKAFLPMTEQGLFQGNDKGLELGLCTVLPGIQDPDGRGVMFFDPSLQDHDRFDREQMIQSFWYGVHAVLEENIEAQKKGVICIASTKNAKITNWDPKLDKLVIESMQGYLPMRVSCITICHPPAFFRIVWPIVKVFFGSRMRKRVRVYGGSDESVVKKMEALGLTKDQMPELVGGNLKVDHLAWLEARRKTGK